MKRSDTKQLWMKERKKADMCGVLIRLPAYESSSSFFFLFLRLHAADGMISSFAQFFFVRLSPRSLTSRLWLAFAGFRLLSLCHLSSNGAFVIAAFESAMQVSKRFVAIASNVHRCCFRINIWTLL